MPIQVEELYTNLNKLLADICDFLSDEVKLEKLSPLNRKEADELIQRSKIQLQEIARISPKKAEYDGAYVDMERKPATNNNEEDKNNIYIYVDEAVSKSTSIIKSVTCPFAEVPVRELSPENKRGYLSWKTKFILNFEKMKRIYCAIENSWFLVYSHEKGNKPSHSFDLNLYEAKIIKSKGKNQDFELISKNEAKKSHYFLAYNKKDMLQWVAHINKSHQSCNLEAEDHPENYDLFIDLQKTTENNEEEGIYQEPSFTNGISGKKFDIPPDLPLRPLPMIKQSSVESIISYDPVEPSDEPLVSTENSFSSEEEDDIYESFVSVKQEKSQITKPEVKQKPSHLLFVKKNLIP